MKTYKSFTPEILLVTEKTNNYIQKAQISSSSAAAEYFKSIWPVDINHREATMALFLNRRHNTVGFATVGIGGVAGCVVDGKILFQQALSCNASAIILAHNHPSGNLEPSTADVNLTDRLTSFGKFIEIAVLDHLILTEHDFYSFTDH